MASRPYERSFTLALSIGRAIRTRIPDARPAVLTFVASLLSKPADARQNGACGVVALTHKGTPPAAGAVGGLLRRAMDLRLFQHELVVVSDANGELVAEGRRHLDAVAGQGVDDVLNWIPRELGELVALFARPCVTAGRERRAVGGDDRHFNPLHGIPFPARQPRSLRILLCRFFKNRGGSGPKNTPAMLAGDTAASLAGSRRSGNCYDGRALAPACRSALVASAC